MGIKNAISLAFPNKNPHLNRGRADSQETKQRIPKEEEGRNGEPCKQTAPATAPCISWCPEPIAPPRAPDEPRQEPAGSREPARAERGTSWPRTEGQSCSLRKLPAHHKHPDRAGDIWVSRSRPNNPPTASGRRGFAGGKGQRDFAVAPGSLVISAAMAGNREPRAPDC